MILHFHLKLGTQMSLIMLMDIIIKTEYNIYQ